MAKGIRLPRMISDNASNAKKLAFIKKLKSIYEKVKSSTKVDKESAKLTREMHTLHKKLEKAIAKMK